MIRHKLSRKYKEPTNATKKKNKSIKRSLLYIYIYRYVCVYNVSLPYILLTKHTTHCDFDDKIFCCFYNAYTLKYHFITRKFIT